MPLCRYSLALCVFSVDVLGHPPYTFNFRVKFYAAEPHTLSEELTRLVATICVKRLI